MQTAQFFTAICRHWMAKCRKFFRNRLRLYKKCFFSIALFQKFRSSKLTEVAIRKFHRPFVLFLQHFYHWKINTLAIWNKNALFDFIKYFKNLIQMKRTNSTFAQSYSPKLDFYKQKILTSMHKFIQTNNKQTV